MQLFTASFKLQVRWAFFFFDIFPKKKAAAGTIICTIILVAEANHNGAISSEEVCLSYGTSSSP